MKRTGIRMKSKHSSQTPDPAADGDTSRNTAGLSTGGRPGMGRRLAWIAAVGSLILVALGAAPGYRLLKTLRARALAEEATQLIDTGQWDAAFRKANAAYQMRPQDPATIRTVARLYTAAKGVQALVFWKLLAERNGSTVDDDRTFLRLALTLNRAGDAAAAVTRILENGERTAEDLRLAAEFHARMGQPSSARSLCREGLAESPDDAGLKLLLANLLSASAEPADRAEAVTILNPLTSLPDPTGLSALGLLVSDRNASIAQVNRLLSILESRSDKDEFPLRLWMAELRMRRNPDRANAYARDAIGPPNSLTPNEMLIAGRWLNSHGYRHLALDLLPRETALQSEDHFLVRLDALAATGQWETVARELELPENPLDPMFVNLFLARAAAETGRNEEAELRWRKVQLSAGNDRDKLAYAARYAESTDARDEAIRFYRRLTRDPAAARDAFRALFRLGERTGNTRAIREWMRDYASQFPDDDAPRNDIPYLDLLLNENLDASFRAAKALHDEDPSMLAYRVTLALAYLRRDEPGSARDLFRGVTLNWAHVLPGWQAVHAAAHGRSGQIDAARAFARQIPIPRLKPEEKALIEPWL